jgi:AAA+ superfamily predicted ATPase
MNGVTPKIEQPPIFGSRHVFDSLCELDMRLLLMVETVRSQSGREPGADPFRGLYVTEADVLRDLSGPEDPARCGDGGQPLAGGPLFKALGEMYGLSRFELDTLLIALAPEIDTRYERIFSYLQDDVNRRRPSIDLVLSLLCKSAADRFDRRSDFGASGRLIAHRLIRLLGDEVVPAPRREVCLHPRIASFLMAETGLDASLAPFVRLIETPSADVMADRGLVRIARRASGRNLPLRVYLRGADEDSKRAAVIALAAELSTPLLIADAGRVARSPGDASERLQDLAREAFLRRAIVYLENVDSIADQAMRDATLAGLAAFRGVVIVSGVHELRENATRLRGIVTIPFEIPGWPERRRAWDAALRENGVDEHGSALDALAECFRFNNSQIEEAAETAANLAEYRGEIAAIGHAFEAARIRSGHELASLTRKVTPVHGWADIVLPESSLEQLRQICRRVAHRHHVMGKWGFERKLSGGKGVNALFHGHSGTGKTMAAEVVARELQLDLYKIDLAGVVSKYIGETEKNLDRIFSAAENSNAILLFDEADALFGKRSEVRDSHDRYANLEVSYLLQKMEEHDGVSILATNLRQNLDDAFLRRLSFAVQFPFPDEAGRQRIWAGIWPQETPLAPDVDAGWLAARFLLSGGNIRNAALAAAYLAVEHESVVTLSHVLRAVRDEFQKMGKSLTAAELAPPVDAAQGVAA